MNERVNNRPEVVVVVERLYREEEKSECDDEKKIGRIY